ncbi:MAG: esterase-like activity of phytase family protein, partial [Novosphingobium sp.]|nr:esterase-like activity of phytase family protein [Novosphingobium sp.]
MAYRPTDMAQLPDGRVLVLLRRLVWPMPPRFAGKIAIADPAEIRKDGTWTGKVAANLASPLPTDNFEGLAVETGEDGETIVWVISDDNTARSQRTILLKLRWLGEPARKKGARFARTPVRTR